MEAHELLALSQTNMDNTLGTPWTESLLCGEAWMMIALLLPVATELDAISDK